MPALGGCRPPGGVSAGPGRVQAARRGLCWPWEGAGRQEGSLLALGGCRPPGGVSAGPGRVQAGRRGCVGPGRVQAARRGLCRPWEGTGRQEGSVPALGGYRPPGGVCAGPGRVRTPKRGL